MKYRLCTHPELHGSTSPRDVDAMSFDDVIEAHEVLDALEDYRERTKPEAS